MIGTAPAPSPASPTEPPARTRGARLTRVLIITIVAAMVGLWVYVLYLAIGPGRQGPPDELDDPAFAIAAQRRCDVALDAVRLLPPAAEAASAAERAVVVAEANATFAAMLDDLDAMVPGGEDGELVAEWLADWRVYLADRVAFADALRTDPGARLLVSAKDGQHITEYLDAFAADNHMPACSTPIDV